MQPKYVQILRRQCSPTQRLSDSPVQSPPPQAPPLVQTWRQSPWRLKSQKNLIRDGKFTFMISTVEYLMFFCCWKYIAIWTEAKDPWYLMEQGEELSIWIPKKCFLINILPKVIYYNFGPQKVFNINLCFWHHGCSSTQAVWSPSPRIDPGPCQQLWILS